MLNNNLSDTQNNIVLNVLINRIVSDLRSGLTIKIIDDNRKNSTFLIACLDVLDEDALNYDDIHYILTRPQRLDYLDKFQTKINNFKKKIKTPDSKEQEEIINFCSSLELLPEVVVFKSNYEPQYSVNEITLKQIQAIKQDSFNQFKMVAKSPMVMANAKKASLYAFRSQYMGYHHYAIVVKNPEKDEVPLVRLHSSCYTGDLMASLRCDCRDQLQGSIKLMDKHPEYHGGIVLYLVQEGRGIGLKNKIHSYSLQQEEGLNTIESNLALGFENDERNFYPAKQILDYFNIKEVDLITNNPRKTRLITEMNVNVRKVVQTYDFAKPNEFNEDYLDVKYSLES